MKKLIKATIYGDLLQKLLHKNKAYEVNKGETEKLYYSWLEKCKKLSVEATMKEFNQTIYEMVNDFEKIELDTSKEKPKVGIVGEILIKYHPFGNNYCTCLLYTSHVTFFFNGGEEKQYNGEDRILVPSPKVETYDMQPEMSAIEVTDKVVEAIESKKYDVIILNLSLIHIYSTCKCNA